MPSGSEQIPQGMYAVLQSRVSYIQRLTCGLMCIRTLGLLDTIISTGSLPEA